MPAVRLGAIDMGVILGWWKWLGCNCRKGAVGLVKIEVDTIVGGYSWLGVQLCMDAVGC